MLQNNLYQWAQISFLPSQYIQYVMELLKVTGTGTDVTKQEKHNNGMPKETDARAWCCAGKPKREKTEFQQRN